MFAFDIFFVAEVLVKWPNLVTLLGDGQLNSSGVLSKLKTSYKI